LGGFYVFFAETEDARPENVSGRVVGRVWVPG